MNRRRAVMAAATGAATLSLMLPAHAATPFSTSSKSAGDPHSATVTQVWQLRTGNDGSFDRIVLDERMSASGYIVKYVHLMLTDPKGAPVKLRGHYVLQITVLDATTLSLPAGTSRIARTYTPGLPEVAQIKKTGEFERVVTFAVGLNHYRGFRVTRLRSPTRLVIDVLH